MLKVGKKKTHLSVVLQNTIITQFFKRTGLISELSVKEIFIYLIMFHCGGKKREQEKREMWSNR